MTIDLTGGLPSSRDLLLAERPRQSDLRESVSMWFSDDAGRFGFPRMCVEALASQWDDRGIQANIAFPDGRVFVPTGSSKAISSLGSDSRPTVLGAETLRFDCIEPFRFWRMTYRDDPFETTIAKQIRGERPSAKRHVEIDIEAEMIVPPWIQGTMSEDARKKMAAGDEALFMGGERYEQLFRCKGSFRVQGEPERRFTGTGLRIHRVGVREMNEFRGHCWQSAVFPSGKAFGYIAFPPYADGKPGYAEGFVFDGKKMMPAKLLEAPWMTKFVPHGGAADIEFETEKGRIRIAGLTHDSTYAVKGTPLFGNWRVDGLVNGVPFPFHQGGARYEWDGEKTYGMIERSYPI